MREIKFRGFNRKNEKWLYGYYFVNRGKHFIVTDGTADPFSTYENYIVDPETVSQFTRLKDKINNTCIYEGDILSLDGNIIGNKYENKDLLKSKTNLLIEGICTKKWYSTYKEAIKRGCYDAE